MEELEIGPSLSMLKRDCSNMLEHNLNKILKVLLLGSLQMEMSMNHMSQMQIETKPKQILD